MPSSAWAWEPPLVLPLIIASEGHTPPRLTPPGLAIALGLTLALPLVMLATYSPRGSVADRVRMIGSMARRHPMAVLATLLILPLSLPMIEAVLLLLTKLTVTLFFLVIDLLPRRPDIRILFRYTYYAPSDLTRYLDRHARRERLARLRLRISMRSRHGYTMLGAVPASLALKTRNGYDPAPIGIGLTEYLIYRMCFTLVIVAGMLGVLAVQARAGWASSPPWTRVGSQSAPNRPMRSRGGRRAGQAAPAASARLSRRISRDRHRPPHPGRGSLPNSHGRRVPTARPSHPCHRDPDGRPSPARHALTSVDVTHRKASRRINLHELSRGAGLEDPVS